MSVSKYIIGLLNKKIDYLMETMEQKPTKELVLFTLPEGNVSVNLIYQNNTLWLNQKLMAELFDKDSDTIGLHIKNIFSENELNENETTEVFSVVQTEGNRKVTRQIKHYNYKFTGTINEIKI